MIICSVFGTAYSLKEWKFLNSAMLAEEDLAEDCEPETDYDSGPISLISSKCSSRSSYIISFLISSLFPFD